MMSGRERPTPEQVRAARGLCDMSQADLADRVKLLRRVVIDYESGRTRPHASTLAAFRTAFAELGIEFVDREDGGLGVGLSRDGLERVRARIVNAPRKRRTSAPGA